jgi:hypothetical protein
MKRIFEDVDRKRVKTELPPLRPVQLARVSQAYSIEQQQQRLLREVNLSEHLFTLLKKSFQEVRRLANRP